MDHRKVSLEEVLRALLFAADVHVFFYKKPHNFLTFGHILVVKMS